MPQLLAHFFGDYILQSDWMAQNKTKRSWPALVHAYTYSIWFWYLAVAYAHHPWLCWFVIFSTHFLIDRFRLARYVVWAKNWLGPWKRYKETIVSEAAFREEAEWCWKWVSPNIPWCYCDKTGYRENVPEHIAFWLLIITDNTLHLAINYAALRWL